MKEPGYIVLYNPISNEGHLDSWHVLFVILLLAAGHRVIAMTSDPEGIARKLASHGVRPGERLLIVRTAWATSSNSGRRLIDRLRLCWADQNARWDALRFQREWRLREAGGLTGRIVAWLQIRANLCLARTARLLHAGYLRARGRANVTVSPSPLLFHPNEFRDQVNSVIARHPGQIDCILNMYIDAYRTDPRTWRDFAFDEGVPWSALHITAPEEPTHAYCGLASFRGVLLLDEAIARRYREAMPGKHVAHLPDITDTTLPERQSGLSRRIARAAAGRKIVFMGGSIGKQKNLECWYQLISLADPDEWFFKAHFYQDPVTPGSLGLESFLQLVKYAAVQRWGWQEGDTLAAVALERRQRWLYRGQVVPTNTQVTVVAWITAVDEGERILTAAGFLSVDGRPIYQMNDFTVQLERA